MAAKARSRVLSEVQAGQLAHYFRRGKIKSDRGYRGPAKVIAVEKGQGQAPMVAWLSHAGTLIRAAPEHLRMATSLETRTYDILADSGVISHNNMAGSRYVDLGEVLTPAEERTAQHMHIDEPPPPDGPGESRSSSSTGPYNDHCYTTTSDVTHG